MNGKAYYNENDPFAAQWLRNLIAAGHIAAGDVDDRSITEVKASDLEGYTQCHFFAGIGGWSDALRLAKWSNDRQVWTGSCPCQPFSKAGKRKGFDDERHLWPFWFELIRKCRPAIIFGEQVASAPVWLDRVCADLEAENYAIGAAVLPACAVDAPHRRDRLWFVANAIGNGRRARRDDHAEYVGRLAATTGEATTDLVMADASSSRSLSCTQAGVYRSKKSAGPRHVEFERPGYRALAATDRDDGFWWSGPLQVGRNAIAGKVTSSGDYSGTQWRIKPGIPLLAHGVSNRVGRLRGYGNAIVPPLAAEFIIAADEALNV